MIFAYSTHADGTRHIVDGPYAGATFTGDVEQALKGLESGTHEICNGAIISREERDRQETRAQMATLQAQLNAEREARISAENTALRAELESLRARLTAAAATPSPAAAPPSPAAILPSDMTPAATPTLS